MKRLAEHQRWWLLSICCCAVKVFLKTSCAQIVRSLKKVILQTAQLLFLDVLDKEKRKTQKRSRRSRQSVLVAKESCNFIKLTDPKMLNTSVSDKALTDQQRIINLQECCFIWTQACRDVSESRRRDRKLTGSFT